MALAIKRACCCKSLRQACIILLYCNLVVYVLGLLSTLKEDNSRSYLYLKHYESNSIKLVDIILALIGCVVIGATIAGIYKKEPSLCWLNIATGSLLIESVYIVFMMVVVNSSSGVDEDETHLGSKISHSHVIFSLNAVLLLALAFDLYSALVCYSYKEELKQRHVYGIPPGQANITDPPNVQFIAAPYPTQPNQCAGLPPQNYTQPAQNPDITPMYPSLSA